MKLIKFLWWKSNHFSSIQINNSFVTFEPVFRKKNAWMIYKVQYMKEEQLQQYYWVNGDSVRSKLFTAVGAVMPFETQDSCSNLLAEYNLIAL